MTSQALAMVSEGPISEKVLALGFLHQNGQSDVSAVRVISCPTLNCLKNIVGAFRLPRVQRCIRAVSSLGISKEPGRSTGQVRCLTSPVCQGHTLCCLGPISEVPSVFCDLYGVLVHVLVV